MSAPARPGLAWFPGVQMLAVLITGCASIPHQPAPVGGQPAAPPAASGAPRFQPAPAAADTPAQLLGQVQDLAARIQAEKDSATRYRLIGQALYLTEACRQHWPDEGTCPYASGMIQGLTARESPARAASILKDMLANLARAESVAPALDHGGPARLTAIVLLRAPGWPLGPGDPDAALAAARRAVAVAGGYPPNLITLGQAQAATGDVPGARASFRNALQAAQATAAGPERDGWIRDAQRGLQGG